MKKVSLHSLFFIVVASLFIINSINGQQKNSYDGLPDSIAVKKNTTLIIGHKIYHFSNDTVIIVPDSIDVEPVIRLPAKHAKKTQDFYDSLKVYSSKHKLTKELFNLIMTVQSQTSGQHNNKTDIQIGKDEFNDFDGKIIRKIYFKKLDVFETSINDISKQPKSWTAKTANNLHINTKTFIIRDNLLFEEGDKIDPYHLSDTERILRKLSFIKDAKIKVLRSSQESDSTDILVITKDVWSIGGSALFKSPQNFDLRLYDANFMGFGRRLENKIIYKDSYTPHFGYKGQFNVTNIGGTFIDGAVTYNNYDDVEFGEISFQKRFITPEVKYGGGLKINFTKDEHIIRKNDTSHMLVPVNFNSQDIWAGRSFKLRHFDRKTIVVSLRASWYNYKERPDPSIYDIKNYYDRKLYLANVNFSNRFYAKGRMIYGFGRTEDIPYGYSIGYTGGYEFNELQNRVYSGITLSGGYIKKDDSYYAGRFEFGSYFNASEYDKTVMRLEIDHFSKLRKVKNYYIRHFINFAFITGLNGSEGDSLSIADKSGIRGFRGQGLYGTKKMVLNLEAVAFAPWYFYGFKFAAFTFADFAVVGRHKNLFRNDFFSGYGIGLRIRNENLVFKTIQVRLAYYPRLTAGFDHHLMTTFAHPRSLMSNGLTPGKPQRISLED